MKEEYSVIHKCRVCGKIIKKPLFIPVSNEVTVVKEILITIGTIPNDTGHQPIERHDICICAAGVYGITDLIGVERANTGATGGIVTGDCIIADHTPTLVIINKTSAMGKSEERLNSIGCQKNKRYSQGIKQPEGHASPDN